MEYYLYSLPPLFKPSQLAASMRRRALPLAVTTLLLMPGKMLGQISTGEIIELSGNSFKYSAVTSASRETLWHLWTDVENWRQFDTSLEYSYLEQAAVFETGAIGYLKADGAPRTRFEVINLDSPNAFALRLRLPLWQTIEQHRYFEPAAEGQTVFTHEVIFKGRLNPLLGLLIGGIYRRETASVVEHLKQLAEDLEKQE